MRSLRIQKTERVAALLVGVIALACGGLSMAGIQDPAPMKADRIQDGFESPRPVWQAEERDANIQVETHDRVQSGAREGVSVERLVFNAGLGSAVYFSYALPQIPVTERLKISLMVRSNRPGVQIFGRVILPRDRDPDTGQPSFLILPGTSLASPDRWQRLELTDLPLAVERQVRVLRADSTRTIDVTGAYLQRILINVYGGAGYSEVWLDDLQIEPVPAELVQQHQTQLQTEPGERPEQAASASTAARITFKGNFLAKDGRPWLPRAISAPSADIKALRRAGFDVLEMPVFAREDEVREATDLGYWILPVLGPSDAPGTDELIERAAAFPHPEAVAFWNVGDDLGRPDDREARKRELDRIRRLVSDLKRSLDRESSRLTQANVADHYAQYALFGRNVDLIGVEPNALASMYEPTDLYRLLVYKRQLSATRNPNALFWAWLPASAPSVLHRAVWGDQAPPGWGWPSIQPEQIRMFAFAALSAGYRGLGFRGDVSLSRPGGLDRLYELTLLIAEIELVEFILARGTDPIVQWPTFPPDPKPVLIYDNSGNAGTLTGNRRTASPPSDEVKAHPTLRVTSIDTEDNRTKLLLINDFAAGGQWQPPQMGYRDVNVLVPAAESAQAYEISFGDVQALESKRDAGGRRLTIPIVNGTALVVVTTDASLVDQIRAQVWALRPRAVDLAIKQAELRLQEAAQLNALLAEQGVTVRNAADLLNAARAMLDGAKDALARQDYATAWVEARSMGQPIRMVLRAHFDRALADFQALVAASLASGSAGTSGVGRPIIPPVACPPLLTCQTLPQYYYWRSFIAGQRGTFGSNRIPSGHFDASPAVLKEQGWVDASHPADGLTSSIRIDQQPQPGASGSTLKLAVAPADLPRPEDFRKPDGKPDALAYERARKTAIEALPAIIEHPAAAVRSPSVPVRARDFVRIRVLVRLPRSVTSAGGGLIVRDSLGGETLQFRTTQASDAWRELVLFRRVPEDGEISVLLGLAGIGEAHFDDLRVEVLGQDAPDTLANSDPLSNAPRLPSASLPDARPVR